MDTGCYHNAVSVEGAAGNVARQFRVLQEMNHPAGVIVSAVQAAGYKGTGWFAVARDDPFAKEGRLVQEAVTEEEESVGEDQRPGQGVVYHHTFDGAILFEGLFDRLLEVTLAI